MKDTKITRQELKKRAKLMKMVGLKPINYLLDYIYDEKNPYIECNYREGRATKSCYDCLNRSGKHPDNCCRIWMRISQNCVCDHLEE